MSDSSLTLPLGAFDLHERPSLDSVIGALFVELSKIDPYYGPEYTQWQAMNPGQIAPRRRLIAHLVKELNRFAPPFCYVGHAPHDENNWGVWIDLGKLHEAEEKGQLVQETQRPTKGRSTYVLIHDQTGLRLFKRRGWVEVWKI